MSDPIEIEGRAICALLRLPTSENPAAEEVKYAAIPIDSAKWTDAAFLMSANHRDTETTAFYSKMAVSVAPPGTGDVVILQHFTAEDPAELEGIANRAVRIALARTFPELQPKEILCGFVNDPEKARTPSFFYSGILDCTQRGFPSHWITVPDPEEWTEGGPIWGRAPYVNGRYHAIHHHQRVRRVANDGEATESEYPLDHPNNECLYGIPSFVDPDRGRSTEETKAVDFEIVDLLKDAGIFLESIPIGDKKYLRLEPDPRVWEEEGFWQVMWSQNQQATFTSDSEKLLEWDEDDDGNPEMTLFSRLNNDGGDEDQYLTPEWVVADIPGNGPGQGTGLSFRLTASRGQAMKGIAHSVYNGNNRRAVYNWQERVDLGGSASETTTYQYEWSWMKASQELTHEYWLQNTSVAQGTYYMLTLGAPRITRKLVIRLRLFADPESTSSAVLTIYNAKPSFTEVLALDDMPSTDRQEVATFRYSDLQARGEDNRDDVVEITIDDPLYAVEPLTGLGYTALCFRVAFTRDPDRQELSEESKSWQETSPPYIFYRFGDNNEGFSFYDYDAFDSKDVLLHSRGDISGA